MQHRSAVSLENGRRQEECTFCQSHHIASYILKETPTFRIVADHAPLLEGHLLIIPRQHYTCYGDVPQELDAELLALKREVQQFLSQFYTTVVFWEHGVFRQTVFHAHLHCFPFGEIKYDLSRALHAQLVLSQADLRSWYSTQGHYFYLEDCQHAFLFPPKLDYYQHVIQDVFWAGTSPRTGHTRWRSAQQRREEGKSLIETTLANWYIFQQQEVHYAD